VSGASRSDVDGWLDGSVPGMPAPLRVAVDAALDRADGGRPAGEAGPEPLDVPEIGPAGTGVPDRLAGAALDALARVIRSSPDRSAAVELLAADALLTYACEAAAEEGPEALDRLLDGLPLARFEALLEEVGS
jgi:hypothetical protein